jgi:cyclophilin family peptidyl-prolyl cis-trans isomerase
LQGGQPLSKVIVVLLFVFSLVFVAAACSPESPPANEQPPTAVPELIGPKKYSGPPPMMIDINKKYIATIVTEKGDIVIELFAKDAPRTVNSFVFLAREGFYDDVTFHRVIPGFMAQGGDPTGTGAGNPGYQFQDEFNQHDHATGVISMANSGPNTNGSQFFITYSPQPGLNGRHTVFGRVTEGMQVLNRLTPRDPTQNPVGKGDTIETIEIQEQS